MSFEEANRRIREKVFRDPVHGYIHIQHQIFLDLINTKEFQRLRRVKQLGTTSFTFHGADHTRFAHCLGVYEIARRIVNQFQRNYPSQEPGDGLWDDQERLVVLCAATSMISATVPSPTPLKNFLVLTMKPSPGLSSCPLRRRSTES